MSVVLTQEATRVRKTLVPNYNDGQSAPQGISPRGELLTAIAQPPKTEIVRLGDSWFGKGVVTTKTLSQTLPTTGAASTLWNGNSAGGKSYVIEGVGYWSDVSGGAANINTLWLATSLTAVSTVPDTVEAGVIRSLRLGKGTYGGNAKISQTVTVVDTWIPIRTTNTAALGANLGIGEYVELNGMFIVPPGYYIALHVCGTSNTAEVGFFYTWHEVQLDF